MHRDCETSSSSEGEAVSPYERTFRLLQKEKEELSSDEREGVILSSEGEDFKARSSEDLVSYLPDPFSDHSRDRRDLGFPFLEALGTQDSEADLQRAELDRLILAIIKREEKTANGVSDLRIKERLLELGQNALVQWALEKIPGPVGMYGYTSLLQKTTEMHLGIRRLLEEERITKKTKRTYVSVAGRSTIPPGPRKKLIQQRVISLFEDPGSENAQSIGFMEATDSDGYRRSKRKRKEIKVMVEEEVPVKAKKPKKPMVVPAPQPLFWPSLVEYAPKLSSGSLSKEVKKRMGESASNFVSEFVRLGIVESPQHAALGGWGVFALQGLEAGKILGEYTGKLRLAEKEKRRFSSKHCLSINFDNSPLCVDVDSQQAGNEFRFVNDVKDAGRSRANVKFETVPLGGEWHILVVTTERISKGEELVADYSLYRAQQTPKEEVQFFNGYQVEQYHFIPQEEAHIQSTIPSGTLFEGIAHSTNNVVRLL
jgi:hypothetical protein